jgi:hypothetical protein
MRTRLAGRFFTQMRPSPPVVVIDEVFARQYCADPLGAHRPNGSIEIVGVVGHVTAGA